MRSMDSSDLGLKWLIEPVSFLYRGHLEASSDLLGSSLCDLRHTSDCGVRHELHSQSLATN